MSCTFNSSCILQLLLQSCQLHVVVEGRPSVDPEVGQAATSLAGNEVLPVGLVHRVPLCLHRGLVVLAQ